MDGWALAGIIMAAVAGTVILTLFLAWFGILWYFMTHNRS